VKLTFRHGLTATGLTALAWLMAVTPTHAACGVDPEQVARSEVVFIGLLTAVAPDGLATFQVEEVWRGEAWVTVGEPVDVEASDEGLEVPPGGASIRYLVVAGERDGVIYTNDPTNTCARAPFPWDDSYAAFRPPQAPVDAEPSPAEGAFPVLPLVIGAAVVIAVAAFAAGTSGRLPRRG
jgi:hypothetical protein